MAPTAPSCTSCARRDCLRMVRCSAVATSRISRVDSASQARRSQSWMMCRSSWQSLLQAVPRRSGTFTSPPGSCLRASAAPILILPKRTRTEPVGKAVRVLQEFKASLGVLADGRPSQSWINSVTMFAFVRSRGNMTELKITREASRKDHLPYEARHIDNVEWETIGWAGETGKMLFHPRPERPTEPNAGILRLEPGAYHPEHYHGFAQVWYILSGEFVIGGTLCTPGAMLYHPDPHFEGEFHTDTGGEILIVQYPGPTTGERPIYAGRFNMAERKTVAEERVDL